MTGRWADVRYAVHVTGPDQAADLARRASDAGATTYELDLERFRSDKAVIKELEAHYADVVGYPMFSLVHADEFLADTYTVGPGNVIVLTGVDGGRPKVGTRLISSLPGAVDRFRSGATKVPFQAVIVSESRRAQVVSLLSETNAWLTRAALHSGYDRTEPSPVLIEGRLQHLHGVGVMPRTGRPEIKTLGNAIRRYRDLLLDLSLPDGSALAFASAFAPRFLTDSANHSRGIRERLDQFFALVNSWIAGSQADELADAALRSAVRELLDEAAADPPRGDEQLRLEWPFFVSTGIEEVAQRNLDLLDPFVDGTMDVDTFRHFFLDRYATDLRDIADPSAYRPMAEFVRLVSAASKPEELRAEAAALLRIVGFRE